MYKLENIRIILEGLKLVDEMEKSCQAGKQNDGI